MGLEQPKCQGEFENSVLSQSQENGDEDFDGPGAPGTRCLSWWPSLEKGRHRPFSQGRWEQIGKDGPRRKRKP